LERNIVVNSQRVKKSLAIISNELQSVLNLYGGDRGFDEYLTNTIYSLLSDLYEDLQELQRRERAGE
jgi:hypothetical protein